VGCADGLMGKDPITVYCNNGVWHPEFYDLKCVTEDEYYPLEGVQYDDRPPLTAAQATWQQTSWLAIFAIIVIVLMVLGCVVRFFLRRHEGRKRRAMALLRARVKHFEDLFSSIKPGSGFKDEEEDLEKPRHLRPRAAEHKAGSRKPEGEGSRGRCREGDSGAGPRARSAEERGPGAGPGRGARCSAAGDSHVPPARGLGEALGGAGRVAVSGAARSGVRWSGAEGWRSGAEAFPTSAAAGQPGGPVEARDPCYGAVVASAPGRPNSRRLQVARQARLAEALSLSALSELGRALPAWAQSTR